MKPARYLPYPKMHQAAAAVAQALTPFVDALAKHSAFNGAILFVPDGHHTNTAGAAVVVNASGKPVKQLAFTRRHIAGRRVDLRASSLGEMFREPAPSYLPSRLNPRGHRVFGLGVGPERTPQAVVQLAFDTATPAALPDASFIRDQYLSQAAAVQSGLGELLSAGREVRSVADALLLAPPTTPNAYVILWDVAGSTQLARTHYGWLRHYLNTFSLEVAGLVAQAGGQITSHRGDGQNIVLPLPPAVDPADPAALRQFQARVARPLVAAIEAAHERIGQTMGIKIRLSHGLGHVESSYLGEATGTEFFRLARVLKSGPLR